MKFYFSSLFVSILLFFFVTVLVVFGLLIGYGWHFATEIYDFMTLQHGADNVVLSDTVKTVTITALLIPYLSAGYIAARIAHHAEYLNTVIAGAVLIGPWVYFYPPASPILWVTYSGCAVVMLIGATMAHWTRVREARRFPNTVNEKPEGDNK